LAKFDQLRKWSQERHIRAVKKSQLAQFKAARAISKISPRDLKMLGLGLYLGEGKKHDRNKLVFVNSDPPAVALVMRFFREIVHIPETAFRAWVQIHEGLDQEKAIRYWVKITGLPNRRFYRIKTILSIRSHRRRPSASLAYGTCHVAVLSTRHADLVKGWMLGARKQVT
jgi:hypothetical protein